MVEDEKDCQTGKVSTFASEMTKWFDTNYHFIVPEFRSDTKFSLSSRKVFDEFSEAKELGIHAKPVLIGPVTYFSLGKVQDSKNPDFDPFALLDQLLSVYEEIIGKLADAGAEWIQLDEPIISTDLNGRQKDALKTAYARLSKAQGSAKLLVTTYFGGVRSNLNHYLSLPVDALHFDFVRGAEDIDAVLAQLEYYLDWAVKAFRLSACGVKDDTQIHTHMCYSEFNDIIESIAAMDADVITIETSRSNMELLNAFVGFKYPNEIGPGVYDIHSPRVPPVEEMVNLMSKAEAVLPRGNLWVNPDCGLKTRRWKEVTPSLINMVESAKALRTELVPA